MTTDSWFDLPEPSRSDWKITPMHRTPATRARLRALIEDPRRDHNLDVGRIIDPHTTRRPSLLVRLRVWWAERGDQRAPLAERPRIAVAPRVVAWNVDMDALRESAELDRMTHDAEVRHQETRLLLLLQDEAPDTGDGPR